MMGSAAAGVRQVRRLNASVALAASKTMRHVWTRLS